MVKEIKIWKSTFYKNDDKNNGAMKKAIDCANGMLVVHSQTKKTGRVWGCVTPDKLLNLVTKNHGLYEVITNYPHKVYFDIDKKIDSITCDNGSESFLKSITDKITTFFPDAEMAISGSITDTKISYHIILQNYAVSNEMERAHLKNIVKFLTKDEPAFDWKVYHNNQFFKCINQSKDDGRIQQIITNEDYTAHLITCFFSKSFLPFPDVVSEELHEHLEIEKAYTPFDVGTLPKHNLITPDDVDFLNITPAQVLALLPCNDSFHHNYTHRTARFCYHNNIPFDEFIKWRSQKSIDADKIKKWKEYHFANIHKFPSVTIDQMKMVLIQFYPKINKNMHFRAFQKSFNFDAKVIKIPRLSPKEFAGNEKVSIFNIGMGGGKTAQTVDYLKYKQNFLWIAPMKALCNNTFNRLTESNIDAKYYLDFSTKDKKNGCFNNVDKLLIVANSLHYLQQTTYDIIVIDEIETFIDKWHGTFMQHKMENWQVFLNVLRKSKKIILLDAFITTKTIHLLESIVGKDIVVYERILEPVTREVRYIKDFHVCISKIITDIKNGLKPFIFYPYKEQSKMNSSYLSMEALYTMIQKETNTEGIYYNADIDDSVKLGLRDVNASWKNKRFVITNAIITCGVNYDLTDFDNEYLFVSSFTSPRDITQVSYRPRTLNTNIIHCCFLGRMTQTNSWETDDLNCPIYTQMTRAIFTEKKSPIRKTVELFFSKANYTQFTTDLKLSEDVQREIDEMIEKQVCVSYRLVEDIDGGYADVIRQKIFSSEATMHEKFMLQKYFFKNQFVTNDETYDGIDAMEYAWNANNAYFIKQCKRLISNPDNVFEKIKILNSEETIFPTDIKNIVLSDTIIKQIFNDYEFKYVHSKSGKPKIIENMFNAYFSKKIVKFEYPTKHTHPDYSIPHYDEFAFFYEYTKKYSTDFVVEDDVIEEEEEEIPIAKQVTKYIERFF